MPAVYPVTVTEVTKCSLVTLYTVSRLLSYMIYFYEDVMSHYDSVAIIHNYP